MVDNIAVNCPTCGKEYDLPADYVAQYAGHAAPCEACGGTFVVPEESDAVLTVDEPDAEATVEESAILLSYASAPVKGRNGHAVGPYSGPWLKHFSGS